jgi:hypothetical protein
VNKVKLTAMTIEYTGCFDCADHSQESNKKLLLQSSRLSGDTGDAGKAQVWTPGKAYLRKNTRLGKGDRFTVDSSAINKPFIGGQIVFKVKVPGTKKVAKFRWATNCKYPVSVGDTFGPFKIVGVHTTVKGGKTGSCTVAGSVKAAAAEISGTKKNPDAASPEASDSSSTEQNSDGSSGDSKNETTSIVLGVVFGLMAALALVGGAVFLLKNRGDNDAEDELTVSSNTGEDLTVSSDAQSTN